VWRKKLIVKSIFHCVQKILTFLTPDKRKSISKPKSQSFEQVREHGLHLFQQTTHQILHVTPSGWAICNPPLPTLYNPGSKSTSLHCTHELDNSGTKIHYVLQLVSRSIKLFNFLALEMDMKAATNISRAHAKHILVTLVLVGTIWQFSICELSKSILHGLSIALGYPQEYPSWVHITVYTSPDSRTSEKHPY
jgi:hypothetical protein